MPNLPKWTLKTTEVSGWKAKKNFGIRLTKLYVLAQSLTERDGSGEVTFSPWTYYFLTYNKQYYVLGLVWRSNETKKELSALITPLHMYIIKEEQKSLFHATRLKSRPKPRASHEIEASVATQLSSSSSAQISFLIPRHRVLKEPTQT